MWQHNFWISYSLSDEQELHCNKVKQLKRWDILPVTFNTLVHVLN